MLNLMSKEENEKHAHRQHYNKHHGNSRMKELVPMEMAAAMMHAQGTERGPAFVLRGFSNSVFQTVIMQELQKHLQ